MNDASLSISYAIQLAAKGQKYYSTNFRKGAKIAKTQRRVKCFGRAFASLRKKLLLLALCWHVVSEVVVG